MSTIHLFNAADDHQNTLGDLEKTTTLNGLLEIPLAERNAEWIAGFLENIDEATLKLGEQEVVMGEFGFPYFHLESAPKNTGFQTFVIKNRLEDFLLTKGFGIAINPQNEKPDWVFTYGDLVNYYLNHEFYTDESLFSDKEQPIVIGTDEEVLVGQPSESILPQIVRQQLREFLSYQGINNPKVMLIARNYTDEALASQDLVFNFVPQQFATEKDYETVMQTISWFLPRHYSILGMDDLQIQNGFMPL